MHRSLLKKITDSFWDFFTTPEEYQEKILRSIRSDRSGSKIDIAEILTLQRQINVGTWNCSSTLYNIVPHRMELVSKGGLLVTCWGYRSKKNSVRSYISAPGFLLEFAFENGRFNFFSDGVKIISGGDILSDKFQLLIGERQFSVTSPRSRSDWNSVWQKPSYIVIEELEKVVIRLLLQPYAENPKIVDSVNLECEVLGASELLAVASLAVILNARFIT